MAGEVMPDKIDYEISKTPSDPWGLEAPEAHEATKRSAAIWVFAGVIVVASAIAVYFVGLKRPAAPVAAPAQVEAPARPAQPLGGDAAQIDLPPLDQTDSLVREMVRMISSHPTVAAWLASNGLIRNFATVVGNVADGKTPAGQLRALRPSSEFRTLGRSGALSIDPRSYERYDTIAAAAASLDPAGSARLYATLKPRIEEANRALGSPDTTFDRTLERALVSLLATPVVDGPIRVEPTGIVYAFASPRLENLTDAQKQLLRTGPRNVRTIQSALREIALALGIPAERLPSPGGKG
jgi:Protein of unknown function (DUF3014)